MIWKTGEPGSNCSKCGGKVEGLLVASQGIIRTCAGCFIEISPDGPIAWEAANFFGCSEDKSIEFAEHIISELETYGIILGRRERLCPICFGSGKIYQGQKCSLCSGSGTLDCKACGNKGFNTVGQKCPICNR